MNGSTGLFQERRFSQDLYLVLAGVKTFFSRYFTEQRTHNITMTVFAKGNRRREASNPGSNYEHIQRSIYDSHFSRFPISIDLNSQFSKLVDSIGTYS
jgi:hypothetical protein